jgi:DNA-directed RNA polymerase beta' subunit
MPPRTDQGQGQGAAFASPAEVLLAHELGRVGVHARVTVRLPAGKAVVDEEHPAPGGSSPPRGRVVTTPGRVLFNALLPEALPFYNLFLTKAHLEHIVADCYRRQGRRATLDLLDRIQRLGFRAATRSGVSLAFDDLTATPGKAEVVRQTAACEQELRKRHENGLLTLAEHDNASLREGLPLLEYWSTARGLRRSRADAHLGTDEAGYLTRRLVAAAHGVVVRGNDCGTDRGIFVEGEGETSGGRPLREALRGRVLLRRLYGPDDGVAFAEGTLVTEEVAREIERLGPGQVEVRSPLTCRAAERWAGAVCRRCYGMDLSTGELVKEGTAVGIIAAQSLGDWGTQLTLQTHQGGGAAHRPPAADRAVARRRGQVHLDKGGGIFFFPRPVGRVRPERAVQAYTGSRAAAVQPPGRARASWRRS